MNLIMVMWDDPLWPRSTKWSWSKCNFTFWELSAPDVVRSNISWRDDRAEGHEVFYCHTRRTIVRGLHGRKQSCVYESWRNDAEAKTWFSLVETKKWIQDIEKELNSVTGSCEPRETKQKGWKVIADSDCVILGGTHFVRLKRRTPWKMKIETEWECPNRQGGQTAEKKNERTDASTNESGSFGTHPKQSCDPAKFLSAVINAS